MVSLSGHLRVKIRSLVVMLGVGVISLRGAPLSAPLFDIPPEFQEFFRLSRVLFLLVTVVWFIFSLYMVIKGRRRVLGKLSLTDKLLGDVLAEAHVVCVWVSRCLYLVTSMLTLVSSPCSANGISSGRCVDLALAYSVGAGTEPDMTCRFKLDEYAGSRRNFVVACRNALAASSACLVTDSCFFPHFDLC